MEITRSEISDGSAVCAVIKDGGDDPDVTHGAEIVARVSLAGARGSVEIAGGEGVGTVTKPGLGLEIGGPAINPVPRRMITESVADAGAELESGIRVEVSVPRGRELAPKTDNPRLGITGGISILGTSGIVIPFSTASFAASIRQNIDVALAMGDKEVVLTTGGRSEDFAREIVSLPDHCYIQMGDFSGYAIQQCAKKGVERAHIAGFIGKLAKMAAGKKQTHVKGSKVDMAFLAGLAKKSGAGGDVVERVLGANTARHVLEIIKDAGQDGFYGEVCSCVHSQMGEHSRGGLPMEVILLDFDGSILARHGEQ
ncbi:cobalt-precorrin-6A synthase [Cenarchaeum symbiosum A]|uniref:Cobalt-precorrin-5B C(1)-methyltransferase n=1 Tax=Cenarchaeum symbiosum (strain A) TaxID=414004 RepID=A0RYY1_CENSY|nr:cobalt-precorrin-6A synthase [Cenarchaeum symbiosum A]